MSQPEGGKKILVWTSEVKEDSQLREQHGEGPFEALEELDGSPWAFVNKQGQTVKIAYKYLEFKP